MLQALLCLPEHTSFQWGSCYQIFSFMHMFCRLFLSFFFWSLYCLSFDLRILITHLVSSNSFYTPAPRMGRGVYCFTSVRLSVLSSVQDIFVGSIFGPVRFLLPVCRLSCFLYTLNIYAHFSSHFSQQLLMAEI